MSESLYPAHASLPVERLDLTIETTIPGPHAWRTTHCAGCLRQLVIGEPVVTSSSGESHLSCVLRRVYEE